jgi:hypothetical protein
MMNEKLMTMIRAGAEFTRGDMTFWIGDAAIRNGVLVWAEMWATDQHHVHAEEDFELRENGDMLDLYSATGEFIGTFEPMTAEARQAANWDAWQQQLETDPRLRDFFGEQVKQLTGN